MCESNALLFLGSNNYLYYDMELFWHEYEFSSDLRMVVVAVDGDVRRDVRVFRRCNTLDWRVPDSCCTGGNRRRTSRDVCPLIRLIEIGVEPTCPECRTSSGYPLKDARSTVNILTYMC